MRISGACAFRLISPAGKEGSTVSSIVCDRWLILGYVTLSSSCVCAAGVLSDWFAVGNGVRQGCRMAPDLFLGPMNHMMERAAHRGIAGVSLGNEVFTDLDFANDVALLAEMLEVFALAMTIMQEEAAVFGLQKNWSKTKIFQVPPSMPCSTVQVADGHVEMVDTFVYLGSMIDSSGGSRGEVLRRIGIARSCMNVLEKESGS